jgi:hypothetical protein
VATKTAASVAAGLESKYTIVRPGRRPLKAFASDPMAGRTALNRVSIDVPNEDDLLPGPCGSRIEVIDFDGAHRCFYPPVNLDADAILMQGGLEPSESDPRFHQQMVYAVAMRTLENFDRALGRVITFHTRRHQRLRLFPHAFHSANAFYDRDLNAILFGYFRADRQDPGQNLPGQNVFTCLSHDIIVHEMTHALVDRLRRHFLEASNEDVLAFHEGFADLVALFQHFTFQELLRTEIQKTGTRLQERGPLVSLAQQFGHATGMGRELRSALSEPDAKLYRTTIEPHERGSILVAAVFDGFFRTYQGRIRDLIRIATGGTGLLPAGDLHPDLVNRIAGEATRTAQAILSMCIRAFDYLPPVDITFGDYLRALITADYELLPADESGQRAAMVDAFRRRGIYPDGVASLAEESLLWPNADAALPPIPVQQEQVMLQYLVSAATSFGRVGSARPVYTSQDYSQTEEGEEVDLSLAMAQKLHTYADINRAKLFLHPTLKIQVQGFHSVFRVASTGQLLIELVAQFVQTDRTLQDQLGGIPLRGGSTVVASADGKVRYVVAKPIDTQSLSTREHAEARIERQRSYLAAYDALDPSICYGTPAEYAARMVRRGSLRALHIG